MENEKQKTDDKTEKEEKKIVCPFCQKEFETKSGLRRHIPHCEASPDEKNEPEENPDEEGIAIFDDRDLSQRNEEDDYECGYCGFKMPKPYKICPDCGEELKWS